MLTITQPSIVYYILLFFYFLVRLRWKRDAPSAHARRQKENKTRALRDGVGESGAPSLRDVCYYVYPIE